MIAKTTVFGLIDPETYKETDHKYKKYLAKTFTKRYLVIQLLGINKFREDQI